MTEKAAREIGNMDDYGYSEIVSLVNSLEKNETGLEPYRIAFLRNITIDPMLPYLKLLCFREGMRPEVYMGEYDNVIQEAMDSKSPLYGFQPSLVVVVLRLNGLSRILADDFLGHSPGEIDDERDRVRDYLFQVLTSMRKNIDAPILLNSFEVPPYTDLGILDYQRAGGQGNTIRALNGELREVANRFDNTYIVDVELLQSRIGYGEFVDNRLWHIGRAPYSREALKLLAVEYFKFITAFRGRSRKCLVLDCDNTLWGGIVGEKGIEGIKIGTTYPGSAYREFQEAIIGLFNRGAILALCSKNNFEDVIEVLEEHPEMVLSKEHFVAMKINWNDKVSNLKAIAEDLNIGLDSMVLVDDSEFEAEMVREYLPDVEVIKLPKDPTLYKDILMSSGLFDSLNYSSEDVKRGSMYKAEVKRKEARGGFTNIEEYLGSLGMVINVAFADKLTIPRIAQLTQRTNQFNLTTKRYSEADISGLSNSDDFDILYVSLKDRFGDMGIVGAAILKHENGDSDIDTFLLSCRALGRGVEKVLLKACLDASRKRSARIIAGKYVKTKKSKQVEDFYQRNGFNTIRSGEGESVFSLDINLAQFEVPDYFSDIVSEV